MEVRLETHRAKPEGSQVLISPAQSSLEPEKPAAVKNYSSTVYRRIWGGLLQGILNTECAEVEKAP
jgi:hypothetical protein